ncbi:hypothetical protein HO133_010819 [Letharia lupina]|uniref:Uncharacterized protein n=1 Tax=Letharia lupina TaxID=560253 RepID=A0A8H6CJB0_9LECA|nr:uncharacterized protein HO133_010819 [Letharia lupina]KAF6224244.1 hypothetical protein HO133_010819 [Letharia lupina]
MTPAFGFSVGDLISAIGLVKRVTKALKETGGAPTDYQLVVIELKGLKSILRHLETLKPTKDNVTHINAIGGMALACQLPLRDFMIASSDGEEVERLRAVVAAKPISLNLLLAMNTSQTLTPMDSPDQEKHSDLMSMAAEL